LNVPERSDNCVADELIAVLGQRESVRLQAPDPDCDLVTDGALVRVKTADHVGEGTERVCDDVNDVDTEEETTSRDNVMDSVVLVAVG
jgi:hypothetical protein